MTATGLAHKYRTVPAAVEVSIAFTRLNVANVISRIGNNQQESS